MSKSNSSTLVDMLFCRVSERPEQIIYRFLEDGEGQEVSFTYSALDEKARAIAVRLQDMGAAGERALLLYPAGLEYIAAFFGCLYAGVIAVPAYPPRPNQSLLRLQSIANDAQAAIALTNKAVKSNIERQFSKAPELQSLTWIAADADDLGSGEAWQKPDISHDTLAFLQYTSGSTGDPKGVMVSHGNLIHNLRLIYNSFEHSPDSSVVTWLPPYHDMGLIGGILQPFYGDFPVTLMAPVSFLQKPFRWLQAVSKYRATSSGGPNFAYDLCINKITDEQKQTLDLSSWEVAFNGAEPVRAETIERFSETFASCGFRQEAFYPCYGMAETTLIVSGSCKHDFPVLQSVHKEQLRGNKIAFVSQDDTNAQPIVSSGVPLGDLQVVIAHPETAAQCEQGQVGEIWVAGASIAQGYWNRTERTRETFRACLADTGEGPFLRTGDLGFLDAQNLFVTGRIKDLIIIRGRNHYPQDIELSVEASHAALKAGCGAAFSAEIGGEECLVLVQEVERSKVRKLDVDQVFTAIRRAVSEQHQLQTHAILLLKPGHVPKTSSGKVRRHACKLGYLEDSLNIIGRWELALTNSNTSKPQDSKPPDIEASSKHLAPSNQTTPALSPQLELSSSSVKRAESIQNWIRYWLSQKLKIDIRAIHPDQAFAEYGLDSMMAVELAEELQSYLSPGQASIESTVVWSFPTIEALSRYLANELGPAAPSTYTASDSIAFSSVRSSQLATSLLEVKPDVSAEDIKHLSEEEVSTLIAKEILELDSVLRED
ncbi:MAG: AMP-binding protein [Elainellaceae cyanobacterium]